MLTNDLVFYFLDICGFMSFPPKKTQRINLNTNRLTTIIGQNLDGGDGERNGVGKSAIIDAIIYLCFGRSPRVSNQGFLNYVDPGTMFLVGEMSRNGVHFRIERGENPSVLRLFEKPHGDTRDWRHKVSENGKSKFIFETTRSKPETNKRIVELLGFDIKLSDVLIVNNPTDKSCFYQKVEEDQRAIVERIFGFTVFTEKAEGLREIRKEETKNLATKESALTATRQANDRVAVQIKQLEEKSNTWAAEKDKTVKFLTQQIRTYQGINFEEEISTLTSLENYKAQIQDVNKSIQTHQQALDVGKKRHNQWDTAHTQSLTTLIDRIEKLEQIDAVAEITNIRNRDSLQDIIRVLIEKIKTGTLEVDTLQQQMEVEHLTKTRLQKEIATIESQIIQLNEAKCPTCGQDWADTKDHVVHSIAEMDARNAEIVEIDKKLIDIKGKFSKTKSAVEKSERQLEKTEKELATLPTASFSSIEEAAKASSELEQLVEQVESHQQETNPHEQSVTEFTELIKSLLITRKELEANTVQESTTFSTLKDAVKAQQDYETVTRQFEDLRDAENPYRQTIDELRENVMKEVDDTEVKALRNRIEHMSLLIKLLSDRDSPLRTDILHEWLPELNERLGRYLEFLELPHKIVFDANMTANFTLNGKELSYGNLSNGQKLRVWLATNITFREIFELINYNINLFFVDELLDKAMSARGTDIAYKLLEQMVHQNKSVFLITHRTELTDMADHSMTIVLEDGLSTIHE